MAYIRLIDEGEATGELAAQYDAAIERAGKVFNIVKSMSLRPAVLERSIALYSEVMHGPSELSRIELELLATVVSATNTCRYWTIAHANDLRDEGADQELADHVRHDWREADLTPAVGALCAFAEKVTLTPSAVERADVDALRDQGWTDLAVSDAVQVIAYFNYITRVADAIGIEDEPEWP